MSSEKISSVTKNSKQTNMVIHQCANYGMQLSKKFVEVTDRTRIWDKTEGQIDRVIPISFPWNLFAGYKIEVRYPIIVSRLNLSWFAYQNIQKYYKHIVFMMSINYAVHLDFFL